MNSSYFALPGRGGASAGRPPAQCGRVSLTLAARFALMVPQPPKPQVNSARPMRAKRRAPGDIGGRYNSTRKLSPWDFPAGSLCLRRFMAGVSISKAVSSNTVKVARFPIKMYGIKIPCSVTSLRTKPGKPIVLIDNMTRLRRHAAPIHGRKNSAMLTARAGALGSKDETDQGDAHVHSQEDIVAGCACGRRHGCNGPGAGRGEDRPDPADDRRPGLDRQADRQRGQALHAAAWRHRRRQEDRR